MHLTLVMAYGIIVWFPHVAYFRYDGKFLGIFLKSIYTTNLWDIWTNFILQSWFLNIFVLCSVANRHNLIGLFFLFELVNWIDGNLCLVFQINVAVPISYHSVHIFLLIFLRQISVILLHLVIYVNYMTFSTDIDLFGSFF